MAKHSVLFVLSTSDAAKIEDFEKKNFTPWTQLPPEKQERNVAGILFADNKDLSYPVSMFQKLSDCVRFNVQIEGATDDDIFPKAVELKMEIEQRWGKEGVFSNLNASNLPTFSKKKVTNFDF